MENYKNLIWWLRWMGQGQPGAATYTRFADAFENIITENAALRRHIENLTDAQAVMVKEFTEKLEELEQVKVERDAARRAVCGMCHKPPDALPPGARCAQKDCQWHPHTQKEV